MIKKALLFLFILTIVSISLEAQIYYYKDSKKETFVFTNVPTTSDAAILRRDSFKIEANMARELFSKQYGSLLAQLCSQYDVDKKLVEAIIEVESNFNPYVISRKGARGLMQLMPDTARIYGVRDIFNAHQNLTAGIQHLKYLMKNYKSLDLVLAAYNAGGEAVKKYGGIPPYRETRNYVRKVKQLYFGTRLASLPSYGSHNAYSKTSSAPKTFYKYTDNKGNTYFSTTPPPDKSFQIIKPPK
jgi:soluble lytic murein transglycosylase-like protein